MGGDEMTKYQANIAYWSNRYEAPNVESFIFRFYGRILKHDFGIDGKKGEKVLDFGCGEGGALNFFHKHGFQVFGVDIAQRDLRVAESNIQPSEYNKTKGNFELISSVPKPGQRYFENLNLGSQWIDVAISIQTLDFLSDSDCQIVLQNIYQQMKPGAVIYASFNGTQLYYFNHSSPIPDGDGLRRVKFDNGRVNYDLLLNFCPSREEMQKKFAMFKTLYIDYYDSSFRNEGSEFRWTFCGTKE